MNSSEVKSLINENVPKEERICGLRLQSECSSQRIGLPGRNVFLSKHLKELRHLIYILLTVHLSITSGR